MELLTPEIMHRTSFLYRDLIQYCIDMLLWVDNDSLPRELRRFDILSKFYRLDMNNLFLCAIYLAQLHPNCIDITTKIK